MMRFQYSVILFIVIFTSQIVAQDKNQVNVPKGSVPVIDGKMSENEWNDSYKISVNDSINFFLKYDEANLYIASDSMVGNLFVVIGNKLYVFHGSYSLGSTIYKYNTNYKLWTNEQKYNWELRGGLIRNSTKDEIADHIKNYMIKYGWTGSTIPMDKVENNEMVISLARLGLNPILSDNNKILNVLITHDDGAWPDLKTIEEEILRIKSGYDLDILDFKYENWGEIIFGE